MIDEETLKGFKQYSEGVAHLEAISYSIWKEVLNNLNSKQIEYVLFSLKIRNELKSKTELLVDLGFTEQEIADRFAKAIQKKL